MTENTKILIVLAYYKRPKMVLNALNSIKDTKYSNWQLDFIDDSGDESFGETLLDFGFDNSKVNYIPILDTEEIKTSIGGSRHGHFMNESIKNSDAEIVIILCDDDALHPDYLGNLNQYYEKNKTILWSYGYVKYYNPSIESYTESIDSYGSRELRGSVDDLNRHTSALNPYCQCDASQVSFRRKCFVENDVWFPSPQTRNLDASIFRDMFRKIGWCYPNKFYTQCKGAFPDQLGNRSKDFDLTTK